MTKISNLILGFSGINLSKAEKKFFRDIKPLGFIIFARNIKDKEQLKQLTSELREVANHEYVQILIDQEGGRVARLKPPHFRQCKPAGIFGSFGVHDLEKAKEAVFINHYLIGKELKLLGINVDCAPVADLLHKGADKIVGDRSFGSNVKLVTELCKAAHQGLQAANVQSIIKHIPGHGRATADSHFTLPIVKTRLDSLEKTDVAIFKNLSEIGWAMTAHVVYTAIDKSAPATLSKKVINYIRNNIKFKGILISDDLVMKALSGGLKAVAEKAQNAGCDILLHCSGSLTEMKEIAEVTKMLDQKLLARIQKPFAINIDKNSLPSSFKKYLNFATIELEQTLNNLLA